MPAGKIIFEDEDFILADFTDNFQVDVRLLLKKEHRSSVIQGFLWNDRTAVVHAVMTMDNQGNRLHVKRYFTPQEYLELRKELAGIRTPKDFILTFLEIISPTISKLCRKVIK